MKTLTLIILSSFLSLNAFAYEAPDCETSEDGFEIACTFTTTTDMEIAYNKYNLYSEDCLTFVNDFGDIELHCFNDDNSDERPTFASFEGAPSSQAVRTPELR